jgi:hypothetical protein
MMPTSLAAGSGLHFMLTGRKSYGTVDTREEAMVAFKAEYEKWLVETGNGNNH